MSAVGSQDPASNLLPNSSPSKTGTGVPESVSGPALTVEQAWEMVLEHILTITRATGAALALRERGTFICKASAGEAPPVGTLANHEDGLVAECIRTGKTVVSADTLRDPRVDPGVCQLLKLGSVVVIPLHANGRVHGLISVSSPDAFAFDDSALEGLSAIAGAIEMILIDSASDASTPAVESSASAATAEVIPPPSKPFASAFVRAMEESSNGNGRTVLDAGGKPTSVEASVTAAELFAAAGTLRTEMAPESTEVVFNSPDVSPDTRAVVENLGSGPAVPEQPQTAHAGTTADDDVEPVTPALAQLAEPSTGTADHSSARAEASLSTVVLAPPVPVASPASRRRWHGLFATAAVCAIIAIVLVVLRSRTSPVVPEPSPATNTQAGEARSQEYAIPEPVPSAKTPSSNIDVTNPPAKGQNIVHSAALSESESPTPAPQSAAPQPVVDQPAQRAMALPPSSMPISKPVEDVVAPPPPAVNGTSHAGSGLNSLVVPAVSAVPVLSPRIDASSVMLAVRHDPKSTFNAARLVTQNLPSYPEAARTAKRQGSVVLQATVSPTGTVSQVRVMDGDSTLSAAATAAVQSWLYEPARLDGRPVESVVLVTMNFRLTQ